MWKGYTQIFTGIVLILWAYLFLYKERNLANEYVLELNYCVMVQNRTKEGKWRVNRTAEWVSPLWAASTELNSLPLISAVREYRLLWSAHAIKLSSAHVPSHYNRALQCKSPQKGMLIHTSSPWSIIEVNGLSRLQWAKHRAWMGKKQR
jgi:hypothetical protein